MATGTGTELSVDVFTEEESLAFLAARTGLRDDRGARELAAELGYLPLALAQAAALIALQGLSYVDYVSRLRASSLGGELVLGTGDRYSGGVAEAITLSVDAVAAADTAGLSLGLLNLVSVLSTDGVSRQRLMHQLAEAPSPAEVDTAVQGLQAASLLSLTADGSTVAVHRLVARVLRERQHRDGTVGATAATACRFLDAVRASLGEAWRSRREARAWVQHVTALSAAVGQGSGDPDVTNALLGLREEAVTYLLDLGDSAGQAIDLGEGLLGDCLRLLGDSDPTTLAAQNDLAGAYQAAGRLADAIPLYEQALAGRERVLGADDPSTLAAQNNLAGAYQQAGRVSEAIALLEATLAALERVLGSEHPSTLTTRNNLAHSYQEVGRNSEAIALLEATLRALERVLGSEHPSTLTTRNNLAYAYQEVGRVDEAIPLYEAALQQGEQALGGAHPSTLASRGNLAGAYQAVGRNDEAIALLEATLAQLERVLGGQHPDTLAARNNLAYAYGAAGRAAEAIALYERTLADMERVLGPDHPNTVTVRENLRRTKRIAESAGKYNVAVTNSRGVQVGNSNVQVNRF